MNRQLFSDTLEENILLGLTEQNVDLAEGTLEYLLGNCEEMQRLWRRDLHS